MTSIKKINNQLFIDTFYRLDEELEKSQIILMKNYYLKKLLPVHCYVLLSISSFPESPIIIDVARKLYKSKAAVGAIVATLEKRKYIKLIASSEDKRAKKIVLTNEGKKIGDVINNIWGEHGLMILKNFNNQEKQVLYKMLNKIEKNIKLFNNDNKIKI